MQKIYGNLFSGCLSKVLPWSSLKSLGLGLDKKVLFTSLDSCRPQRGDSRPPDDPSSGGSSDDSDDDRRRRPRRGRGHGHGHGFSPGGGGDNSDDDHSGQSYDSSSDYRRRRAHIFNHLINVYTACTV